MQPKQLKINLFCKYFDFAIDSMYPDGVCRLPYYIIEKSAYKAYSPVEKHIVLNVAGSETTAFALRTTQYWVQSNLSQDDLMPQHSSSDDVTVSLSYWLCPHGEWTCLGPPTVSAIGPDVCPLIKTSPLPRGNSISWSQPHPYTFYIPVLFLPVTTATGKVWL